jgi:hypothetical protein
MNEITETFRRNRAGRDQALSKMRLDLQRHHNVPHDHPKAQALFDLVWEHGHALGLSEVRAMYAEFVTLLDLESTR